MAVNKGRRRNKIYNRKIIGKEEERREERREKREANRRSLSWRVGEIS